MDIDFKQPVDLIIRDLFQDLERSTVDRKHPFRFFYLATNGVDEFPAQRTVVLRRVLPDGDFMIFTDYRSRKIQQIKLESQVSLLFYDSIRQVQISFQAKATIHHHDALCLREWKNMIDSSKKDYQTILPPGSDLQADQENPTHDPAFGSDFFSIISIKPINVDVLQLSRAGHQRMVGQFENGEWSGSRVMP